MMDRTAMSSHQKFSFVRPGLWPSLITLAGLFTLLGLGFWQIERLDWKQGIIAKIAEQSASAPVSAPSYRASWDIGMEYRRVTATGAFRHDLEVPIYALGRDGAPGYHIFTPLNMSEGRGAVLVNRGWVPEELKLASGRVAGLSEGNIRVDGVLRTPKRPNNFTPDNNAVADQWYWPDLTAMAEARGLENLAGYVIEASADANAQKMGLAPPYGGATRLQIKNDHLGYALTWFGLAFVLLVIFAIYHIRRPAQK